MNQPSRLPSSGFWLIIKDRVVLILWRTGYEGVGIGLSLVWHLTEMQKGEVVVDSEVGSGSRFQIHFPWHRDS